MKRFTCILLLFAGVLAQAQVRTYSENASKTFVVGLDSYFYGDAGSLSFEAAGQSFQASKGADGVFVGGQRLGSDGDVVIGIHDFTGDRVPEFVMAQRLENAIGLWIYSLNGSSWSPLKMMSVRGAKEVRIFRQVISVRQGEALCSWTWHGDKFDYKASDGSAEPTSL
ncbi:MAG: hypothetical protein VZR22_03250 [Candidatus Cryptobacteroides sp.]|nr:hypothetical protein [Candidatus Cryptobacteroides sp.]